MSGGRFISEEGRSGQRFIFLLVESDATRPGRRRSVVNGRVMRNEHFLLYGRDGLKAAMMCTVQSKRRKMSSRSIVVLTNFKMEYEILNPRTNKID